MERRSTAAGAVLVAGLLVILGPTATAWAHEERTVGRYHVEVGFGDEPPYAGFRNSVQLIVTDAASGRPVTDLGDSVKVAVMTGQASVDLSLEPNFEIGGDGELGDYRAWFIPTSPGAYTFRFTGTIKGTPFNQAFTSGPSTFDDVKDPTQAEFPVQAPANSVLAQRLVQESNRQQALLAAARSHADSEARSARLLAVVGIAVGLLGVGSGIGGLWAARKAVRAAGLLGDSRVTATERS
jgi:hypothetical protein